MAPIKRSKAATTTTTSSPSTSSNSNNSNNNYNNAKQLHPPDKRRRRERPKRKSKTKSMLAISFGNNTNSYYQQQATRTWNNLSKQLICDILLLLAIIMAPAHQAHGQLQPAPQSSPSSDTESSLRQAFLEEPKDAYAIENSSASFSCAIVAKKGEINWWRDKVIVIDTYNKRMFNETSEQPAIDGSGGQSQLVTNYTIEVQNLNLNDDSKFLCSLSVHNEQKRIKSRPAQLTVLRAPTRLELSGHLFDQQPNEQLRNEQHYLHPQLHQSQQLPQAETATQIESDTLRMVVKEGSRLRLDCRADSAKPRAELIWLDHNGKEVPQANVSQPEDESSYEELDQVDSSNPQLQAVNLVWPFRAKKEHHNRPLTCMAHHRALDLQGREPLRRKFLLEVLYKPEVELTKEPVHLFEGRPARFRCQAQARPSVNRYSWYIDGKLIANASEPELLIESMSRQLHLRDIECEASNDVDANRKTLRLAVHHAPSFVSHLLPESLQPQELVEPLVPPSPISGISSDLRFQLAASRGDPIQSRRQKLARQLAVGFEPGQTLQLRCDFDGNPKPQQVSWFKIATNYSDLRDQTPEQSQHLIRFGVQAIFRQDQQQQQYSRLQKRRRHIAPVFVGDVEAQMAEELQLDYELMSGQLLDELNQLERSGQNGSISEQLEVLSSNTSPSQTSATIYEPLAWQMVTSRVATRNEGEQRFVPSLSLYRPAAQAANLHERMAHLASSHLSLKSDDDSDGKYVCRAHSIDHMAPKQHSESMAARAVFLVRRSGPRIISTPRQWVSSDARQIRIECLAQINTVDDNATVFIWSRNGQTIEDSHTQDSSKVITIEPMERSPDLLFARSVLRIEGYGRDDLGDYNCTIVNSIRSDHLAIRVEQLARTGLAFDIMATLTIGSLIILLCVASAVIILAPCRQLEKTKLASASGIVSSSSSSSLSSATKQPMATTTTATASNVPLNDVPNDDTSASNTNDAVSSNWRPNDANLLDNRSITSGSTIARPNSAFASTATNNTSTPMHWVTNGRTGSTNSKFAAIHESLEHKLSASLAQPASTRTVTSAAPSSVDGLDTVAEVTVVDQRSLVDRILKRLLATRQQSADETPHTNSRRLQHQRQRPTISGPLPADGLKRSSLSNSLSLLGSTANEVLNHNHHFNHNLNHNEHHHHAATGSQFVSSSVNLIQDSTTGSDGTASSGRSSSISGQQQQQHQQQHQHHQLHQQQTGYLPATGWPVTLATHQPATMDNNNPVSDCSLYANGASYGSTTLDSVANNSAKFYANQPPIYAHANGWPPHQDGHLDQQQQHQVATSHYQLPMNMMGHSAAATASSYIVAPASMVEARPCYATICTKPLNGITAATISAYGTTTTAVDQLVPTSDYGDTYYETNYDTLLSTSSANKKLGYGTSAGQQQQQQQQLYGSASSTPNSLTTHANGSGNHLSTSLNHSFASHNQLETNLNGAHQMLLTSTQQPHQPASPTTNSNTIYVQSSEVVVAKGSPNSNQKTALGLATHV